MDLLARLLPGVTYSNNPSLELIPFNSSPPGQNGHHFANDIFNYVFLNENVWISIKISLKFVPKGPIDNNIGLV